MKSLKALTLLGSCLAPMLASAQALDRVPRDHNVLQPVVITGTTPARRLWLSPATVDAVDADEVHNGQLQVNVSESLGRVPGLLIQNRQNYAQDLQISVRGYGARSTFGVRGVRLFVDGIPASAPDGQGQAANFPLGITERIEVVRGPFAALYGSSAGGVITLYTAEGQAPASLQAGVAAGADGTRRASTQAQGRVGSLNYALDASSFANDGLRPQSSARRNTDYLKLSYPYEDGRLVATVSHQTGTAQDPLGQSRTEFAANAYQTTLAARMFDTRKSFDQAQLGAAWEHRLGNGQRLELMGYVGRRAVIQHQAIPVAAQSSATSPGGVIDLERSYGGINARWRVDRDWGSGRLTASLGVASDRQNEWRRGFENFTGTATAPTQSGVTGRLRRDERNTASTLDPYAQIEWESAVWTLAAGLRESRVRMASSDHYVAPGNADDSGSSDYTGTMPVLGLRYRLTETLQAYASTGLGFETPTMNEVAYQASGASGLNSRLQASRSRNSEMGLRSRHADSAWAATVFHIRTDNEIAVLSNTGGRSTFQNAGGSLRQGLELSAESKLGGGVSLTAALTLMDATYSESFKTCASSPCATPTLTIPAGNRIPGVAGRSLFAQLAWEPKKLPGVYTMEARHMGPIAANDTNSEQTDAYTVLNLGARFVQTSGAWQVSEFLRIDNVANRVYAGSVIVNEGNGRYFEAAAGRSLFAGVTFLRRFP
jgi:iron complex outermembrane receptor protein